MKDGILKYILKGAVGVGVVGAPIVVGHVISAIAKAKSPTVSGMNNTLVDAVCCFGVAGVETAGIVLISKNKAKALAMVAPLAGTGAFLGTTGSHADDFVEYVARAAIGAPQTTATNAAAAAVQAPPGGIGKSLMSSSGVSPGGIQKALASGSGVPGGIGTRGKGLSNTSGDVWIG